MRVIGLDLSLKSTGVAGDTWTEKIVTGDRRGHDRLQYLRDAVTDYTRHADLVVIEGLSFGSYDTDRAGAGLSWIVRHDLWRRGTGYGLVPPSNRMKYATGKGQANKEAVLLAVARLFPWFAGGNDEADALVLAAMGYDRAGSPLVRLPETHRRALTGSYWPGEALADLVRTGDGAP